MVRSTFVSDSPDVMASAAADPADVEADLGSGSGVRCDTGVKWTMSVSLAEYQYFRILRGGGDGGAEISNSTDVYSCAHEHLSTNLVPTLVVRID